MSFATKRREKRANEKAEAELAAIRRRALDTAPYLTPSSQSFHAATVPTDDPMRERFLQAGDPHLLCFLRDEVDPKHVLAGDQIYLVIQNRGGEAVEIEATIDGERCFFPVLSATDQTLEFPALCYGYNPALHGSEQILEIKFLAANGVRDIHRYKIVHGIRAIKRIDPE